MKKHYLIIGILLLAIGCKKQPVPPADTALDRSVFTNTGSFIYDLYVPLSLKPVEVFYHIPASATVSSPVLIAFHGAGRDGAYSRNALIDKADEYGVIILAPTFSVNYYPGGDQYNLGNVFIDGDNPSAATLNPEEEWTFSAVEPIFDYFVAQLGSTATSFDLFGHSAGGQFVHRLVLLKSGLRFNRAVPAAAGWYTVPDTAITFPYGTKKAPIDFTSILETFSRRVYVIVGEDDDDPNSAGLRHNSYADAQGLNRFDRAHHFYNRSAAIAKAAGQTFVWRLHVVPDIAHSYAGNGAFAMDQLYKN